MKLVQRVLVALAAFAAASVAQIPVQRMFRSLLMPLATVILALMLITYVPELVLWLPRQMGYQG